MNEIEIKIMLAGLMGIMLIILLIINHLSDRIQSNSKLIRETARLSVEAIKDYRKDQKYYGFFNDIAKEALGGVYFDRIRMDNPCISNEEAWNIVNDMIMERESAHNYLTRNKKWLNAGQILHGKY